MKIFVTGGGGYVGTRLVEDLLDDGFEVIVYDAFFFGNFLPFGHKNLEIVKGDLRDSELLVQSIPIGSTVIHLACISNDASFQLNPDLSTSVNYDAFSILLEACKARNIKRFIYASTSSVYGVSDEPEITETHSLKPITLYNKYKALCEPILLEFAKDNFEATIFRPATVCGYSKRMRFDLSVNVLTASALFKNRITIFGGSQLRPNLHILDYIRLVKLLLVSDECVGEIFNAGDQNLSILEIGNLVKDTLGGLEKKYKDIELATEHSDDIRSYHINSDKIKNLLNFAPIFDIEHAVLEIYTAFKDNRFPLGMDNMLYHNVKTLKTNNIE